MTTQDTNTCFSEALIGNADVGAQQASPAYGVSVANSAWAVVGSRFLDGVEIDGRDGGGNALLKNGAVLSV